MHQYGWTLQYIFSLTKEQMILFHKAASKRINIENKFLANINGANIESNTLDVDGAIPIENVLERGAF
jgi:hypothetical protein